MRAAALFSGGKDSALAAWHAMQQGVEVAVLVTLLPESTASYMFHHPNVEWTALQASASGIPQIMRKTAGEKEAELGDLHAALREAVREYGIKAVISGALASNYQKRRVDAACEELGLLSIAPLWGKDQEALLGEIAQDFEAVVTSVSADGFDESWLGRKIDEGCIADLLRLRKRYGISLGGEGGEYESFVLNAPFFTKRVRIVESERAWSKTSGTLRIIRAVI